MLFNFIHSLSSLFCWLILYTTIKTVPTECWGIKCLAQKHLEICHLRVESITHPLSHTRSLSTVEIWRGSFLMDLFYRGAVSRFSGIRGSMCLAAARRSLEQRICKAAQWGFVSNHVSVNRTNPASQSAIQRTSLRRAKLLNNQTRRTQWNTRGQKSARREVSRML